MTLCGFQGKPVMKESSEKAARLHPAAAVLPRSSQQPNRTVPEAELVDLVRTDYKAGPGTQEYRKHVMSNAIRPRYGQFPFERFGYGTFVEFAARHGLQIYN